MSLDHHTRRLRLARDLSAGRIDEATARKQLAGNIGLGRDDLALLRLMELEARMLADDRLTPGDAAQRFSEFAQEIEDPIASLSMAFEAEAVANAEAA